MNGMTCSIFKPSFGLAITATPHWSSLFKYSFSTEVQQRSSKAAFPQAFEVGPVTFHTSMRASPKPQIELAQHQVKCPFVGDKASNFAQCDSKLLGFKWQQVVKKGKKQPFNRKHTCVDLLPP